MLITIYDTHTQQSKSQSTKNSIILGVHNFTYFLASMSNKKNISILLQGNPIQIIQHVLWNEFYGHTMLKDIQKVLASQIEVRNSYLKINGITYRFNQCVEWENAQKLKQQILKYSNFLIESFMDQGNIRYFNIEVGETKYKKFDLIFEYKHESLNNSQLWGSTNRSNSKNFSRTGNKNEIGKNSTISKSLFEIYKPKQKQESQKYLTEKKRNQNVSKKISKQLENKKSSRSKNSKKSRSKSRSRSKIVSYCNKENGQTTFVGQNIANFISKTKINDDYMLRKQQLVATLLSKKEEKIRQYRQMLQTRQKQFDLKLEDIQLSHQQEVATIKQQVKNILSTYKHKNKQLRKQNKCLIEVNQKLTLANKKLQDTLNTMQLDIQMLKENQIKLQKDNQQYRIKYEGVERTNLILNEQINQQRTNYKAETSEKDKEMYQIKSKYERLLGSVKMAALQTEKQNII